MDHLTCLYHTYANQALHPDVQAFLTLLQKRIHDVPATRAEALATARLVAAFSRLLFFLSSSEEGQEQGPRGSVGDLLAQLATLSDRALSQLRCVVWIMMKTGTYTLIVVSSSQLQLRQRRGAGGAWLHLPSAGI